MKRFYWAIMLAFLVTMQTMTIEASELKTGELNGTVATAEASYSYSQLKKDLQQALTKREEAVTKTYTKTNIQTVLDDLKKAVNEIKKEDTYIAGVYGGYKSNASSKGDVVTLTVSLSYLVSATEEKFVSAEVSSILKSIIKPKMTDVEKVRAIHDYVVLNTTYTDKAKGSVHSPYTLLKEGRGVCQSYALTTQLLLEAAGFEALYVTGQAKGNHAWNMVKIGKDWFHIDATWNDPVGMNDDSYIKYEYFLLSDKQIAKTHKLDANNYPKASNETYTAVQAMEKPVEVDGIVYFSNRNDNSKLYQIDLKAKKPVAKKVSDTRVKNLVYVNNMLYFSNYSDGAYLYKMDVKSKDEKVLKAEKVTAIEVAGKKVVAYNDKKVVYQEAIK